MKDVKIIVTVLCKHLNFLFQMNLKPELFRLAKFNKTADNVVPTLWILICRLLELSETGDIVRSVKNYFLKVLKYKNAHFYMLPDSMSSGSRELLLAFGYLLSENYLNQHVKNLVKDSMFNPNLKSEDVGDTHERSDYDDINWKQIKTEDDFQNLLKWIEGQTTFNQREYQEYRCSFYNLWLKKNNFSINAYNMSSLSEIEIIALCSEEHAKDFLEGTHIVSKAVHYHLRWLQVQSEFWEWMNSVLLERQTSMKSINMKELTSYLSSI